MRAADVDRPLRRRGVRGRSPGNLADATVAAERVRVAFQAAAGMVAECRLDATVSIGAASGGIDVACLIAAADAALYRAKAGGRNRVEGVELGLPAGVAPPFVSGSRSPAACLALECPRTRRLTENVQSASATAVARRDATRSRSMGLDASHTSVC